MSICEIFRRITKLPNFYTTCGFFHIDKNLLVSHDFNWIGCVNDPFGEPDWI